MNSRTVAAVCLLIAVLPLVVSGAVRCEALPLEHCSLAPGQGDVAVILLKLTNDDISPHTVSGLTVTYTGDAAADIAAGSLALYNSADGEAWTSLLSGGSFAGTAANLSGFSLALDPAASRYLKVTAGMATAVTNGDRVDVHIAPESIVVDDSLVPAAALLDSLDDAEPHRVRVVATRLHIEAPAAQAAGVPFSVTFVASDDYGNAATSHAGSVTTIAAGDGVSAAPGGQAADLPKSYCWTGGEAGRASVTVVAYRSGAGQRLKVSDTILSGEQSAAFAVSCGGAAHYQCQGSSSIARGYPVRLTLTACDQWGNHAETYAGTASVQSSDRDCLAPAAVEFSNGQAVFTVVFHTAGSQALRIQDAADASLFTGMTVDVVDTAPPPGPAPIAARAWPTVFRPQVGPLRIRYFLKEDRDVTITIYTLLMDAVREIRAAGGLAGGTAGVNEVEWDGRGGDGGEWGRSGGYHIRIDKGYEVEWTGAVIKNF